MNPVRVLVVDDSTTMRKVLSSVLSRDAGIEVVGAVRDAAEARQAIKLMNPDVLTLDVELPGMSGLDFLDKLMRLRPMPVVMVSSLTAKGSEAAIAALTTGAIDCFVKPQGLEPRHFDELLAKIKLASRANVRAHCSVARPAQDTQEFVAASRIIAIGSSTGGVEALEEVLSGFPKSCAPTVITQHLPREFTRSLANRLDRAVPPKVSEAVHGSPLLPGHVYIAPGGEHHLEIAIRNGQGCCVLKSGATVNGHRPSVDVLFASAARHAGAAGVGVVLTGMGNDGTKGLLEMRKAGARTLGQDKASSVVYGMPRAAFEAGAVELQLPLERISDEIRRLTRA